MELVTPSSGEKTYYRMLNNRQVMLSDKEGTISQSLLAEHYILNKNNSLFSLLFSKQDGK